MARKLTKFETPYYIPEDVIETIFSFLPFKKLCSLSILSKRFQHSWRFCRNLCFDHDFARNLSRDECRSIIDGFFSHHASTCADTFKLHYDATDESSVIGFWVRDAIALGIKDLELDLTQTDDKISLDYEIVNVESLHTLKLVNCDLHMLPTSIGLRYLREITLQSVMAPPMLTESIFTNCGSITSVRLIRCTLVYYIRAFARKLDTLVVKDCNDVRSIEVDSPCLRVFHYHGKMIELRFNSLMKFLGDVALEIAHPRGFHHLPHMDEMLNALAFVEVLTLTTIFLEGLCARFENNVYKKKEFTLKKLKEFHLIVASESFLNPSDVVIFITKCPILEKLYIDFGRDAFSSSQYWVEYGMSYLNGSKEVFPFLKEVKIKGFAMRELQIYMAQYLLKNAINLQRLILVKARIHYFPMDYNPEILRWESSSQAKIEMYNYRADNKANTSGEFRIRE